MYLSTYVSYGCDWTLEAKLGPASGPVGLFTFFPFAVQPGFIFFTFAWPRLSNSHVSSVHVIPQSRPRRDALSSVLLDFTPIASRALEFLEFLLCTA